MLRTACEGQKSIPTSLSTAQVNAISCKTPHLHAKPGSCGQAWQGPHSALKVLTAGTGSHNIPTLIRKRPQRDLSLHTAWFLRVKVFLVLTYVKKHFKTESYCIKKSPAHCHQEDNRSEGGAPPNSSANSKFLQYSCATCSSNSRIIKWIKAINLGHRWRKCRNQAPQVWRNIFYSLSTNRRLYMYRKSKDMPALNWKSTERIKMAKYFEAALASRIAQIHFIQAVLKLILKRFSKCVKWILRVEVHWYKSLTRPGVNGFTAWLIKTAFVCLARWPRSQFSRAIAIAYHENYRLCSRKGKHQKRTFVLHFLLSSFGCSFLSVISHLQGDPEHKPF